MARVLVVEDDPQTGAEIKAALTDHGFQVDAAISGREALLQAAKESYDAIVLDRILPGGLDGLGVLSTLRAVGVEAPVLILSALSAVDERVVGLRAGGDDYLTKPFEFLELTARLDVLLRHRDSPGVETMLRAGRLEMDLGSKIVRCGGRVVELLPREFRLLEFLMRHAGQVVTRSMLFEEIWNYRSVGPTNVIDMHMSKLRRKLDPDNSESLIWTIRGAGYMLRATG
ncbi:response regulator transcription factor [Rhodopila sp.]|uniref:response regulator transcription factor n=1 Tax=Rhodopila sp. TaxID=2480087 RepID=UPI003D0A2A94